jgi:hypothetical protein
MKFLKDRFSEHFIKKIEDTLKQVATMRYDVEEFRMQMAQFTPKKETEDLELRLEKMCPMTLFSSLSKRLDTFALQDDLVQQQQMFKDLSTQLEDYAKTDNMDKSLRKM